MKQIRSSFNNNDVRKYLKEIRKYPVLEKEEMLELFYKYKSGDKKAREAIINSNLKLVVHFAFRYFQGLSSLHLMDIIQEGNIGLMRSLDCYDPKKGAFTTHAYFYIRREILTSIYTKDDLIRKPVHINQKINAIKNKFDDATAEEICEKINIDESTLSSIYNSASSNIYSLDYSYDDDDKVTFENFVVHDNDVFDEVFNSINDKELFIFLKRLLSPLEYFVIYHKLNSRNKMSYAAIGKLLNITGTRTQDIYFKSIKKITPYCKNRNIESPYKNGITNYDLLNIKPITPLDITKYLYVKDSLTGIEDSILRYQLFSYYKFSKEQLIKIIKIDMITYNESLYNLNQKLDKAFKDTKAFKEYSNKMIKERKGLLYKLCDEEIKTLKKHI